MPTRKIAALIARVVFALVVVAGVFLLLPRQAMDSNNSLAQSQEQARIVSSKPWRVEPVKVVAAKTKKKGNIDIDKTFGEDDDWLDGFEVTVLNNYDQPVTSVTIDLLFPRAPGDNRPRVGQPLHFGPSAVAPEYIQRDPNKVIRVGETADLRLSPRNYRSLKDGLEQQGYANSIKQVEVVITEVGFEDGSVLISGKFYLPDPEHPNDPTKKVDPTKKPPLPKTRGLTITESADYLTNRQLSLKICYGEPLSPLTRLIQRTATSRIGRLGFGAMLTTNVVVGMTS